MPIRMRKDEGSSSSSQSRIPKSSRGGGRGGGAGNIIAFLPMILNLFKRNPKVGIGLLIAAVVLYFFFAQSGGCTNNYAEGNPLGIFSTGANLDKDVYDKAEVFMPLANNAKNPLPEQVSLLEFCPDRKNQGKQGSCVGWACAYAARTIMHARQSGDDPDMVRFSPSYLYNQIALEDCQGSYLQNAMKVMKNEGVAPFSEFAYNENSCAKKPNANQKKIAANFKTKGFTRLSKDHNKYETDLLAVKQNLAQGAPVVIGMMVGGSFMSDMMGKEVWKPNQNDYNSVNSFGGHAMCVIGYDDYKLGGAFQIMNSWGEEWGKEGVFWMRYNDFDYFNREAYGLHPMGNAEKFNTSKLSADIGLVYKNSTDNIPLTYVDGITFKTSKPVKIDTDFKVEVTNSIECYVYIFGEETDGSNYVLFPYTKKHSPYCGITGTRVFPHDHSMYADNIGNKDRMAVIISKQPLDYNKLDNAINKAPGKSYEQKVINAIGNERVTDINFTGGDDFSFTCDVTYKNTVAVILEIDKK